MAVPNMLCSVVRFSGPQEGTWSFLHGGRVKLGLAVDSRTSLPLPVPISRIRWRLAHRAPYDVATGCHDMRTFAATY